MQNIPSLLFPLLLLEFLQALLGHLDDVVGLLLWDEVGLGEGAAV